MDAAFDQRSLGVAYTLATGRLFCDMADFHRFAETLAGRPIFTHEFVSSALWTELREMFEDDVLSTLTDHDHPETSNV